MNLQFVNSHDGWQRPNEEEIHLELCKASVRNKGGDRDWKKDTWAVISLVGCSLTF